MHAPNLQSLFKRPEGASKPTTTHHRTPFSFNIPPKSDASILLGNRYLNRGDGLVISSSSGMGKSSMSHQMAADWALGLPFFGIQPNGTLKILIVQSEDSDGDIAEVWQSLRHVRGYSAAQIATLEKNIRIISEKSRRGVKFLNWLRAEIADFEPDIVMLNPLQAYIDGDVTDSKDLGFFLREGLNGMNPAAGDKKAFGWIVIHHTTKPATGKDRNERLWHEVMYDMAGGAEIINWARGIISLRALEEPGKFRAVLAKRGRRAGVTKAVAQGAGERAEIVTQFGLQHSSGFLPGPSGERTDTGIIYWEPLDLPNAEEAPMPSKGGRPSKYPFAEFRGVFPKAGDPGKPFNQIKQALVSGGVPTGSVSGVLERWKADGDVEMLLAEDGPARYRAAF